MDIETSYRWFALHTKARAEKKVYQELRRKEIETYLPLRKELRQWSDRKKWVETPVIRSYIFVRIPMTDYRKVFDAKGVVSYVSHKGKAVPIPDREIEAMRRTIDNNLSFSVETSNLCKGKTVTVSSGPLKGVTGKVTEIRSEKKLYLQIGPIGYTLVVDLEG